MKIKTHFFGKDCLVARSLADRALLKEALKKEGFSGGDVLFVNQIHGSEVITIDAKSKIHGQQNLPKADAIVTNLTNLNIGIVTADCAPILFFDANKKVIAAAHAGWRGAKGGIIAATIVAMKKLGAQEVSAIIGPMIQQDSYEVSREFLDEFLGESATNSTFFKKGENANKYFFNLPTYIEKKLRDAGVLKIQNDQIDTYKNSKSLFSFRRSTHLKEKDCGRNISVIAIEEN
jgi:YfiH family protein